MHSALVIVAAMVLWSGAHSWLAGPAARVCARRRLGPRAADGTYRLAYNLLSVLTFLPVIALIALLPDRLIYRLPAWALAVTLPLQLSAAAALLVALWQVDLPRFLGFRQLARWLRGAPEPRDTPTLFTGGAYGWLRHPLYFFSLVIIWLTPVMTANVLAFNAAATAYLYVGSILEERKLVDEFGEAYRAHQRRVPRLIPRPPAWQRPK